MDFHWQRWFDNEDNPHDTTCIFSLIGRPLVLGIAYCAFVMSVSVTKNSIVPEVAF